MKRSTSSYLPADPAALKALAPGKGVIEGRPPMLDDKLSLLDELDCMCGWLGDGFPNSVGPPDCSSLSSVARYEACASAEEGHRKKGTSRTCSHFTCILACQT